MDAAFFTLIIDDIVCHDGRALMGQLGGGGPQSIFGYQVCADVVATVGLSACIGPDCPLSAMEWLERYHVATEGILQTTHSTPRAWQLCEVDGRRTHVSHAAGRHFWSIASLRMALPLAGMEDKI
eukprot:jgi/Ulvmu1/2757/UM014_0215.1